MNIIFLPSFHRDIKKIKKANSNILEFIENLIIEIKQIDNIQQIKNLKKISGTFNHYYRIKIKDYRVGILIDNKTIFFVRLLPRKDIYKHFP